jgi:hypothetical protein
VRWRAPSARAVTQAATRVLSESTCRWKAPRIGKTARVDARAVEAILALGGRPSTGGHGARQGASEAESPVLRAAENAAAGKRRSRAVLVSSSINEWRNAGHSSEAGEAPSSAALPGAGLPQGGPTPLSGWLRGSRSELIAEVVAAAQAAGSGVERFSGARFECRLQRSVRRIFPARSR